MADFPTLGRTHPAGFADAVRREIVVQHESIAVIPLQRIDHLGIPVGAEGNHHQSLSLAAGKVGRTVGARQYAGFDVNRAHGVAVAPVDARLSGQNAAAHGLFFQRLDFIGNRVRVRRISRRRRPSRILPLRAQRGDGALANFRQGLLPFALVGNPIGLFDALARFADHPLGESLIALRRLPLPFRLAGLLAEFAHRADDRLTLFVAEHHRAEHLLFSEEIGFRLDHQNRRFRARHHQIEG